MTELVAGRREGSHACVRTKTTLPPFRRCSRVILASGHSKPTAETQRREPADGVAWVLQRLTPYELGEALGGATFCFLGSTRLLVLAVRILEAVPPVTPSSRTPLVVGVRWFRTRTGPSRSLRLPLRVRSAAASLPR